MFQYIIGFVAFLVVFSNPIGDFFYPNRAAQVKDASPRPKLNESLLAIDAPNATTPECAPDGYLARIVSREPLIVYLEGFLNQEEREHLLDIRYAELLSNRLSWYSLTLIVNRSLSLQLSPAMARQHIATPQSVTLTSLSSQELTPSAASSPAPAPFKAGARSSGSSV